MTEYHAVETRRLIGWLLLTFVAGIAIGATTTLVVLFA